MLIRISLIVAIVASLATAGISFVKVKEKITNLMAERDRERTDKETAQRDLASTRKDLASTKKELDNTKSDLATTTSELEKAVATVASEQKRAAELSQRLAKTTEERDNFDRELATWKAVGLSVDQVLAEMVQAKQIKTDRTNMVNAIASLNRQLKVATNLLAQLTGDDPVVPLPPELRGKVVVVDPKYDFVVLDVGEKQGLAQNGILLVNRNGKLVAKLKVRSVQPDRSIANVIPGWKLGEVMEGDSVLPGI